MPHNDVTRSQSEGNTLKFVLSDSCSVANVFIKNVDKEANLNEKLLPICDLFRDSNLDYRDRDDIKTCCHVRFPDCFAGLNSFSQINLFKNTVQCRTHAETGCGNSTSDIRWVIL